MEMDCQNTHTIRRDYSAVLQRNRNLLSRNIVQPVPTYSERSKSHPRNASQISRFKLPTRQHAQRHLLIFSSPLEKGKQQSCPMAAATQRSPRPSACRELGWSKSRIGCVNFWCYRAPRCIMGDPPTLLGTLHPHLSSRTLTWLLDHSHQLQILLCILTPKAESNQKKPELKSAHWAGIHSTAGQRAQGFFPSLFPLNTSRFPFLVFSP